MNREELKNYAIGQFITANPHAKIEEARLFSDGAVMVWDWQAKKQALERAKQPVAAFNPAATTFTGTPL